MKAMNPIKVSVVVPVYNVKTYLSECLNSILAQTLREIEIILVDDGSTDGSEIICDEYAQKDPRISVIHKENRGYGHTINVGMATAKGTYVGIVESDDYIVETMYERLFSVIESEHLDFVRSNFQRFYETPSGNRHFSVNGTTNIGHPYGVVLGQNDFDTYMLAGGNNWSSLFRRDFLEQHQIRHNESPGASFQDTGFALLCFSLAERLILLSDNLYCYRLDNPGSSSVSKEKLFCCLDEHKYVQNYFSTRNQAIPHPSAMMRNLINCFKFDINRICSSVLEEYLAVVHAYLLENPYQMKDLVVDQHDIPFFEGLKEGNFLGKLQFHLEQKEKGRAFLSPYDSIVLYGAGNYGQYFHDILIGHRLDYKLSSYVVTNDHETEAIKTIPVKSIHDIAPEETDLLVICAKKDSENWYRMKETGQALGFSSIVTCQEVFEFLGDSEALIL